MSDGAAFFNKSSLLVLLMMFFHFIQIQHANAAADLALNGDFIGSRLLFLLLILSLNSWRKRRKSILFD